MGRVPSVRVFPRDLNPYLREFRRKPRARKPQNSERLGRQARPGIELGTSYLPVLSAERNSYRENNGRVNFLLSKFIIVRINFLCISSN